jgi:formylglycine-generating enzyme required for sulfatase activity
MFWYLLFGLTAFADDLCNEGGASEREACLRYEIEKLKGSQSSDKPSPADEIAARKLFVEMLEAMEKNNTSRAKSIYDDLDQNYSSTKVFRRAKKTGKELEVFEKPVLDFGTVDINWLQGQESAQLGQDGLNIFIFWEEWCPHCRREVPNMQKVLDTYSKDGLQVVGFTKLTRSSTEEDAKQFLKENDVSYSIGVEDGTLSRYYNVSGIPASVVVQDGTVIYRGHPARITDDMITKWIAVVKIPAGTFTMGCTSEQGDDCYDNEKPAHQVTISKDFYLMENEVTQALYERVMGENPSEFKGANLPVETVSWYDAVKFCNKHSQLEGLDQCYTINGENVSWSNKSCNGWRLPTEAEWEYAARGGQSYKYAGSDNIDEVAWHYGNSDTGNGEQTHPVGQKKPNGFGLYDMSGNVFEWVWDGFGDYSSQGGTDLVGPDSGQYRVSRGGSWRYGARDARVSIRRYNRPDNVYYGGLGFRPGRTP